jgi:hypothetical protein
VDRKFHFPPVGAIVAVPALLGLFGPNVQDVERFLEFVRHVHTPIPARHQLPVNALKYLPSRDRGLPPRRVFVRKLLSFAVDLGAPVRNVIEVSRHTQEMRFAWFHVLCHARLSLAAANRDWSTDRSGAHQSLRSAPASTWHHAQPRQVSDWLALVTWLPAQPFVLQGSGFVSLCGDPAWRTPNQLKKRLPNGISQYLFPRPDQDKS